MLCVCCVRYNPFTGAKTILDEMQLRFPQKRGCSAKGAKAPPLRKIERPYRNLKVCVWNVLLISEASRELRLLRLPVLGGVLR